MAHPSPPLLNTPLQIITKTQAAPVLIWAQVKSLPPITSNDHPPKELKDLLPSAFLRKERYEITLRDTPAFEGILDVHWKEKILRPLANPQPAKIPGYVSFQAVVFQAKPTPTPCIVIRLANDDAEKQDLAQLPFWSLQECTQSLTPAPQQNLHRTIDGRLVDTGSAQHQKYLSTLTCKDPQSLAIEDLWVGVALWVDCVQKLHCPLMPEALRMTLARDPVDNSVFLVRPGEEPVALSPTGRTVTLDSPPISPGSFLTYRPCLLMRLADFRVATDPWGLAVGWTMQLEEI